MVALSSIASISPGFHPRRELPSVSDGDGYLVQLRDLTGDGTINRHSLQSIYSTTIPDRYRIQSGDVLLTSRGNENIAVAVATNVILFASGHFFIIRPDISLALPKFLVWYFKQPAWRRSTSALKQGTDILQLPLADLKQIDITLPELSVQNTITNLENLASREIDLEKQITEKRARIREWLMRQAVFGEKVNA